MDPSLIQVFIEKIEAEKSNTTENNHEEQSVKYKIKIIYNEINSWEILRSWKETKDLMLKIQDDYPDYVAFCPSTDHPVSGEQLVDFIKEVFGLVQSNFWKYLPFLNYLDDFTKQRIEMKMLIDPIKAQKLIEKGDEEHGIAGKVIRHEPNITHLFPYQFIYGKYREDCEHLYWKPEHRLSVKNQEQESMLEEFKADEAKDHPFRDILRLKLSAIMLQSRPRYTVEGTKYSAQNLKIARYLRYGWLQGCFLLHKEAKNCVFKEKWAQFPFEAQPIDEIKEYFGEKVAIYHAFMDHYTKYLLIPSIVAIPFQIAVFATNNFSASFIPFYALLLPLWSIVQSENWKRKEKFLALQWGMINFHRDEYDRPEFKGEEHPSHIDGSLRQYFSRRLKETRIALSVGATLLLCMLVMGSVAGIYIMRFAVSAVVGGPANAQTLASICNALLIEALNQLYKFLAEALSEWENHRTDSAFEDSIIAKIFVFQFINSYASFFYLAFIAQYMGECPEDTGCMPSLAYNLGIIFATKYIAGSVIRRLLIPFLRLRWKKRDYELRMCSSPFPRKMTRAEEEFLKKPIDIQKYFFEEYADVIVQIGYMALFASALPLSSFFSLVLNVLKIRSEVWIWFHLRQMPLPRGSETIGSWKTIKDLIAVISIITNAALIVFTMKNRLQQYSLTFRFWVFVLFQWISFLLQVIAKYLLRDETETIRVQQQREHFIIKKLIYKQPDDEAGYEPRKATVPLSFHPIPTEQEMMVFHQ